VDTPRYPAVTRLRASTRLVCGGGPAINGARAVPYLSVLASRELLNPFFCLARSHL
jgi:hypothetical protein